MVRTGAWAERLRWHRYHTLKDTEDVSTSPSADNGEHFIKMPCYKTTTRPVLKGNAALETVINACTSQIISKDNRRKIKDNLQPEQRQALQELTALPVTHGAACRFADESRVTVVTSLKEEYGKISEALHDPAHYQIVGKNPNQ
ncbi:hypothetical protein ACOMHN_043728 [Nucella lapillus]